MGRLRAHGHSLDRWWNAAVHIAAHGIGLAIADGILYLAHCPPEQTRERIDKERAEGIVVDDVELAALIDEARRVGFTRSYGTVVPGLSAASVPVLDSQDRLVATMSVLSRSEQKAFFSKAKIERLIEVAHSASRAIGWRG